MNPVGPDSLILRVSGFAMSRLDEHTLAVDEYSGKYVVLNPTAGRVWELLSEPISMNLLCATLESEFGISHSQCTEDITGFLATLQKAGFVTIY